MGIKVAKFGGSSVADGIQLTKTRQIIEQDPDGAEAILRAHFKGIVEFAKEGCKR